jgi:uncharacterized protein
MPETPHVAAMAVTLFIPASNSLKTKRRVLKSIKDRVRSSFNVSVSEIGDLDKWQSAVLGVAMIGNDKSYISGAMDNVLNLIQSVHEAQVTTHQIEFI